MKYLFLNNENIDVCLPPYLRINMKSWLKRQIQDFDTSCQQYICCVSTGFNTIQKIKEIMRYAGGGGGTPYIPFISRSAVFDEFCKQMRFLLFVLVGNVYGRCDCTEPKPVQKRTCPCEQRQIYVSEIRLV